MERLSVTWLAAMVCAAIGCAEGMPGPDEFGRQQSLGNGTMALPVVTATPDAAMPAEAPPPAPMNSGVPCMMGARVDCVCSDGVSMGVQVCRADGRSTTGGFLSMCEQCKPPPPPMETMPDAGAMGDVGMAGSDSMSGSSTAGSGGSAAGSGDSGSGGSAGSMAMEPECDPDTCPKQTDLLGLPLQSCCTRRGECGTRSLLLGICNAN